MVQPVHFFAAAAPISGLLNDITGLVYVIGPPEGPVKIGRTANPISRWKKLRSELGDQFWVHHVIWTDDPVYLERQLHRLFDEWWIQHEQGTEWYDLNPNQLAWLMQFEAIDAEWMKGYMGKRMVGSLPTPDYEVNW